MTKIPPSQQLQQQIEQLWRQGSDGTASILSTVRRLGAQRVVQELLEHEVTDFFGRDHYRRGPRRITG
jgi:putative transposase